MCLPDDELDIDQNVMRTQVWHDELCFMVSTIEKTSPEGELLYATSVWEWNDELDRQEGLVGEFESVHGSVEPHLDVCRNLYDNGEFCAPEGLHVPRPG